MRVDSTLLFFVQLIAVVSVANASVVERQGPVKELCGATDALCGPGQPPCCSGFECGGVEPPLKANLGVR